MNKSTNSHNFFSKKHNQYKISQNPFYFLNFAGEAGLKILLHKTPEKVILQTN